MATIGNPPESPAYGVPLTVEGAVVLHQFFRIRWAEWKQLDEATRVAITAEAAEALAPAETESRSALFWILGHKADLLALHLRDTFAELQAVELAWAQLRLSNYADLVSSYVSVAELSLHDSSLKLFSALEEKGTTPFGPEWNEAVQETLDRQKSAMLPRLYPKIPSTSALCFYPMNRRRGEEKNWYALPLANRQQQMDQHGSVGRRWAGKVQQIVSASIGFDDWEWGVTLFSNNPIEFKKLIYEMRYDEVSAVYSDFGEFFFGLRVPVKGLASLLKGKVPEFAAQPLPVHGRPA